MTDDSRRNFVREMLNVESEPQSRTIKSFTISGITSYRFPRRVVVRPLTILSGKNSAGKSGAIKSLLLLKQTLDHAVDAGPLLVAGPNVVFTSLDQLFTRIPNSEQESVLAIDIEMPNGRLKLTFTRDSQSGFSLSKQLYEFDDLWGLDSKDRLVLSPEVDTDYIAEQIPSTARVVALESAQDFRTYAQTSAWAQAQSLMGDWWLTASQQQRDDAEEGFEDHFQRELKQLWVVDRHRCFLSASLSSFFLSNRFDHHTIDPANAPGSNFADAIKQLIHVPATRINNFRTNPPAEVSKSFQGTFEHYTASVIAKWEHDADERLEKLTRSLRDLDLTSSISTSRISDVEVEVRVARLGSAGLRDKDDMVSLADVGVGVSYVLPVLVALEAASPGQFLYLEHPESHLHPRAEYRLAKALSQAAKRGVRVVVETHSALLLLHIQTLVAKGELEASDVAFHWFTLDKGGFTNIDFVQPDEQGRTGDWPEDFADTEMNAHSAFLRAVRDV